MITWRRQTAIMSEQAISDENVIEEKEQLPLGKGEMLVQN